MIRAKRLASSRPMYAFDPDTFEGEDHEYGGYREMRAVWFRRKNGVLVASMGRYRLSVGWGYPGDDPKPDDMYDEWVARHADNRYGGSHLASWDGTALLCSDQPVSPEIAARRVEFLSAMLAGYPEPPANYDGWYEFPKETAR
jgi:hypothetical protein